VVRVWRWGAWSRGQKSPAGSRGRESSSGDLGPLPQEADKLVFQAVWKLIVWCLMVYLQSLLTPPHHTPKTVWISQIPANSANPPTLTAKKKLFESLPIPLWPSLGRWSAVIESVRQSSRSLKWWPASCAEIHQTQPSPEIWLKKKFDGALFGHICQKWPECWTCPRGPKSSYCIIIIINVGDLTVWLLQQTVRVPSRWVQRACFYQR